MFAEIERFIDRLEKLFFEIKYRSFMKDGKFYVVFCKSIGDIIASCGCMRYFKRLRGGDRLGIIAWEQRREIIDAILGEEFEIIYLDKKHIDDFLRPLLTAKRYENKFLVAAPVLCFAKNHYFDEIKDYPKINLMDFIKYCLFKIKSEEDFYLPRNLNIVCSNKCDPLSAHDIVLCPYATAIKAISVSFWEKLADALSAMGYSVFTNVAMNGKESGVIKGTRKLSCTLIELVSLAHSAKCVIGIRSGILDWLLFSETPLVALYPDESMMTFYRLSALIDKGNTTEFCLGQDSDADIGRIIEIVERAG